MADNHTMLSRSGNSGDGKKTERLDIPINEELKAECITMATLEGLPVSEWARNVLVRALHGELGMMRRMRLLGRSSHGTNGGGSSDENQS